MAAARIPNMVNLVTWPFRSEICLFLSFSVLSLVAFLLESNIDQYEYDEVENVMLHNVSSLSDGGISDALPTALEFKSIFIFAVLFLCSALYAVAKTLQYLFFSKLTEPERIKLSKYFFRFALLRIVILSGVINVTRLVSVYAWIAWFSVLGLLHSCSLVVASRCNQLTVSSSVSKFEWTRLAGTVVFLLFTNVLLFKAGLVGSMLLADIQALDGLHTGANREMHSGFRTPTTLGVLKAKLTGKKDAIYDAVDVETFIAAECILLLLSVMNVFIKLLIQAYDRRMASIGRSWTSQASFTYNVELIHVLSIRSIELAHYVHILLWSRLFSVASLIIFLHIRFAFSALVNRIHRHIAYVRLINYIKDHYESHSVGLLNREEKSKANDGSSPLESNATSPEDRDDSPITIPAVDICAICWEDMYAWRRLPCRHDFHESCLRSWLEQHPTCPTCRRDLEIPPSAAAAVSETNRNIGHAADQLIPGLLVRTITRLSDTNAAQPSVRQPHDTPYVRRGPHTTTSFLNRRLWTSTFGSHQANDAASSSQASPNSEGESGSLSEAAGSRPSQSTQAGGQSNQTQYSARYLSWINAELSEMVRHILTDSTQLTVGEVPAAAQDLFTETRSTDSEESPANHELIHLHQRLRGPALEIANILPQFPLSMIVGDLLQTGIPERTVDNLLSRPAPSASSTASVTEPSSQDGLSTMQTDPHQHSDAQPTVDNRDTAASTTARRRQFVDRFRRLLFNYRHD